MTKNADEDRLGGKIGDSHGGTVGFVDETYFELSLDNFSEDAGAVDCYGRDSEFFVVAWGKGGLVGHYFFFVFIFVHLLSASLMVIVVEWFGGHSEGALVRGLDGGWDIGSSWLLGFCS